MPKFVRQIVSNFRAKVARHYIQKKVIATLQLAHADELAHTPGELWPQIRDKHVAQIQAVRDGKLNIVDRRSWAFPYLPSTLTRLQQPIIKMCVSADTEFLTYRGWIAAEDLVKTDTFASRTSKGEFVWVKAKKLMKYRYKGEMLNFVGTNVDQLITPDHRMLGRYMHIDCTEDGRRLTVPGVEQMMFAKDVAALPKNGNSYRYQIPLAASSWQGVVPKDKRKIVFSVESEHVGRKPQSYAVDLKDWIAFLGLWLAEGSISGSHCGIDKTKKGTLASQALSTKCLDARANWKPKAYQGYGIGISQSTNSKHFAKIEVLLDKLPFNFQRKGNGWHTTSKALWEALSTLGNTYTVAIPKWVKELPTDYLALLVDWMVLGDGHIFPIDRSVKQLHRHTSVDSSIAVKMYGTSSKALADDIQEVMQKLGLSTGTTVRKPKQLQKIFKQKQPLKGRLSSPFYHVNFKCLSWAGVGRPVSVDYDGYVYCPALPPHETILIRRNGKVSWSGNTPYNLRRFARTPVPRRAINLIKNAVTSLDWDILPIKNVTLASDEDQATRIQTGKTCLKHPNNEQSFQEFLETGIDDFCIYGGMVVEPQITPDPKRPIKMWNVDCSTIRFFPNWRESDPDQPKYAQMTGLKGERGIIVFYADELMYIKDNPSVETPFGTAKMEVGFQSITSFLGVQDMSGKAGSDQVQKTWLWWEAGVAPSNMDLLRRHLTNDIEGQAKINTMTGLKEPSVIQVQTVQEGDLLLPWHEMLIRMIAAAFDMSAQAFLERDINRSTGEVLQDMDFRSAVVPTAVRIAEYMTRFILHKKLGWTDLEFQFLNLDDPDLQTKIDMLSKVYAMNASTPNEIRAELGKPPSTSPYSNLTQFEAILVNTQAAAAIADANASKASDRAAAQQQQQMEQYQQMQQQQGGDQPADKQQAAAALPAPGKLGAPKAPAGPKALKLVPPKAPKLPMMPMAGSRYNAYQIAAMSLPELKAAIAKGDVPGNAKQLTQNMSTQDPSILLQLEPGVQEYIKMLQKEQDKEEAKSKVAITPQAIKDQKKKFRQGQHVPADIERNLFPDNIKPGDVTPSYTSLRPAFADKRVRTSPGINVIKPKAKKQVKTAQQIQKSQAGTNRGKEISTTDVIKTRKNRR